MGEEEWPEHLLQVEAAAARARVRVPRRPSTSTFTEAVKPSLATVEASA